MILPPQFSTFLEKEPQLFRFRNSLTHNQQVSLQNQLSGISLDLLDKQKQLMHKSMDANQHAFESVDNFLFSGNSDNRVQGQQMIEQGRLGCLLLAGGQGTRFQSLGPKGIFPISVIQHKSLFQLFAEKVKAASGKAKRPLDLAIMTSEENDEDTRSFFHTHHFFGLAPSQVSFFVQKTLPFLDASGKMFLQKPWQVAVGPNGNGDSLLGFAKSGIMNQWMKKGIEYVHLILVDNPLADPFDAELLGFHRQQQVEVTLKCTEKVNPEEKVGSLVKQNGRYRVIEYAEMSAEEKSARKSNGRLKHCCANLSLFCFSLSFIQRLVDEHLSLPLHKAWKIAPYVDEKGVSHFSKQPMAWKFETFIFDWLIYTQKVAALVYPREQCFAPLKNAVGVDSPETVKAALQQMDKKIIQNITGMPPPGFPFELAQEFYYPTPELIRKWKSQTVKNSYVEA